MPINVEDVLIRVLVNSDAAVRDLKKTNQAVDNLGKKTKISAKQLISMGAAFGGVSMAVDLAIKAIASYIAYIKSAEDAYAEAAKKEGEFLSEGVRAYDRLKEAKEADMLINGELHLEYMSQHRERRAARIEETVLVKGLTDYENELWREANAGLFTWNEGFETRIEFAQRLAEEEAADNKERLAMLDRIEAQRLRYIREGRAAMEERKEADKEAEAAAIAISQAEYDRMMRNASAADIEAEREAEKYRIQFQYEQSLSDYKEEQHQIELERIAEAKEANKQAAFEVLGAYSSFFTSMDSLISNRYQAEADAAEAGSEAQQKALLKQFKAEKAFSLVQAAIATAVGITQAIPNPFLMAFAGINGALQIGAIAATQPPSFATGTPPGGFTVPGGYENDNFPIMASSGETVTVDRPNSGGGDSGILYASLNIDGYEFGKVVTRLFADRKAVISKVNVA